MHFKTQFLEVEICRTLKILVITILYKEKINKSVVKRKYMET